MKVQTAKWAASVSRKPSLSNVRRFSTFETSIVHAVVLLSSGVACILGGKLTDYLIEARGLRAGRSIAVVAMPLSGLFLAIAALSRNNVLCAVCLCLAAGMLDLGLGGMWSICHDIGQKAAGTVTGCMNMFGNFGGTLSPIVLGKLVAWNGSWILPILIASTVSVMCGALMLTVDPHKRLGETT